ncbi:MAG: thioesterase domain-containing protein, partial [Sinobacteraceae bacterium]|nr:thioesterase domain-containing protein [Nevskiaceae bacterium]
MRPARPRPGSINIITKGDISQGTDASGNPIAGGFINNNAIWAVNNGTGGISVDSSAATLRASGWGGIYANNANASSTGDIVIQSGDIPVAQDAVIRAVQAGTGNISVDSTAGTLTTTYNDGIGDGIYARINNASSAGNINITAGEIKNYTGIAGSSFTSPQGLTWFVETENDGTGGTTVNATKDFTLASGVSGSGINVYQPNANAGGDISVTTKNISVSGVGVQVGDGAVVSDSIVA